MNGLAQLGFDFTLTHEYLKAGLLVSLLSVWVLVGVFYYLNRYTKRRYFSIWTVAWLFYALWLTLNLSLHAIPQGGWELLFRQWCISVAAVFLLWGSMQFLGRLVRQGLMILFLCFLFVWSYISTMLLTSQLEIQLPIFALIGLSSMVAAWGFFVYRSRRQYVGSGLLGFGFSFWGCYLIAYPFLQVSEDLICAGFFISTVLQLFIAVSMIILVLEQVRFSNQRRTAQELRRKDQEKQVLQTQVLSTEERYRRLFDQASEAIVIAATTDLRLLELNQAAERILGVSRSDANQQSLTAFCPPPPSTAPAPKTGPDWCVWICSQRPLNLVHKDGSVVASEVQGSPVDWAGRPAYQFFVREVTNQSRLEQQLRHAEKLSALGEMISGVTHELNNVLTVVKGLLDITLTRKQWTVRTQTDLEKATQESERAIRLVNNFLAVAREQPEQRELLDINELVQRVTDLRKFGFMVAGIELRLNLDPQLPRTVANADQVQQVLLNLVNNALHAAATVPKDGCLQISTRRLNGSIQVLVEDNGPGVPPPLQQKIFEPFFTTKPVGVGTGLGLSIAHSIVTEHCGRIYYQLSALGGAGFVVELPLDTRLPQAAAVNGTAPDSTSPTAPLPDPAKTGTAAASDPPRNPP